MLNNEKKFWIGLVILTVVLNSISLIRIYHLRPLYFDPIARERANAAIIFLREKRGFSGTDLKLLQVTKISGGYQFDFDYLYRQPKLSTKVQKIEIKTVGTNFEFLSI